MPKVGQEPVRRAALVDATIAEIGRAGSLDVTVGQIAKRAGMSPALAHYYFHTKDEIFLAAMRHILSEFGQAVRRRLEGATRPEARLAAIVDASLSREQFAPEIVSAWLVFYVEAQHSPEAARLLRVYARRMRSNLVYALKAFLDPGAAEAAAEGAAAMIDGFYIRHALAEGAPDRATARALVRGYLNMHLAPTGARLEES